MVPAGSYLLPLVASSLAAGLTHWTLIPSVTVDETSCTVKNHFVVLTTLVFSNRNEQSKKWQ